MASETLVITEEHLLEVIEVIQAGLKHRKNTSITVKKQLIKWCLEEWSYVAKNVEEGDDA